MVEQDDSILVKQCLDGKTAKFGDLVRKYSKPIYNLALRMVNDEESAADIAQSAFIKAYENLKKFDLDLKFFSWLYRIAINEALNFLERRRQTDPLDDELVSTDASPEEAFLEVERNAIIKRALMKLTPDQRSVIVLRHFMDLSYAQMGETLGIAEGMVKSRLFSARRHLKELLKGKGL